jgi:hypothetical protein
MSEHRIVMDVSTMLPSYVDRMPFTVKVGWLKVYNIALDQYGEDSALRIANLWALRKLDDLASKPAESDLSEEIVSKQLNEVVAASKEAKEFVSFKLTPANSEMICYSEDGEIVIEAVLADTTYSSDGKKFSDDALIAMAEQINTKGIAMPDIAHEEYNSLLEECATAEDFKNQLKEKKGLLKKIKAFYQDGKLMIKAWLDKRYKRHTSLYKSLSIEAYSPMDRQDGDTYMWAEPLSFTFTNTPKIAGANVLAVQG